MADGSSDGGTGILGVVVGALLVLALGYFVFGDRMGLRAPDDVEVTIDTPPPTPRSN
jgi:hypothetical protein